jgi:hypothetical protein
LEEEESETLVEVLWAVVVDFLSRSVQSLVSLSLLLVLASENPRENLRVCLSVDEVVEGVSRLGLDRPVLELPVVMEDLDLLLDICSFGQEETRRWHSHPYPALS